MEILHQLGQLVLGSIPTMLLFLGLLLAYQTLVYRPLGRVLAERRERTEGAIEKARAAIAAAETKTEDYEEKLRAAWISASREREGKLKQWTLEREEALVAARTVAQQHVHEAQAKLEASFDDSRKRIEVASQQLAAQIVAHLLAPAGAQAERAH